MATPKKIIFDELKSKGLSRIVSKIKSIRKDNNSIRVQTVDLFKQDRETLQALLDTYTQGNFDGMQDLYVYDKAKPEREFSVKYAFLNNDFSEVEREKIKSMLRLKYDVFDDQSSQRVFNRWYDQVVWTKLCELGDIKMKVIEVIESKRWKNTKTGQTASIYGAVPYQGDQGPWIIETVGWTWRLDNGTVGLGRMPAKTRAEAEEIMRKVNSL